MAGSRVWWLLVTLCAGFGGSACGWLFFGVWGDLLASGVDCLVDVVGWQIQGVGHLVVWVTGASGDIIRFWQSGVVWTSCDRGSVSWCWNAWLAQYVRGGAIGDWHRTLWYTSLPVGGGRGLSLLCRTELGAVFVEAIESWAAYRSLSVWDQMRGRRRSVYGVVWVAIVSGWCSCSRVRGGITEGYHWFGRAEEVVLGVETETHEVFTPLLGRLSSMTTQ
ncbi:hypothetical protein EDB92DRAFT_1812849 [Lactarius akahatsu]|uniref:Uncharacterized protein n=1 Tax=Lactarius akahatsu TaxID=416441 RepID=A0AAD4QHD7_9AGAM|nr:hypothetical protein EDB92DRAFT_1812849 [Lactarius akahatsu]